MGPLVLFPFVLIAGALQSVGNSMNAQLNRSLVNPFLASVISFVLIVAVFVLVLGVFHRPLPTGAQVAAMPWWAPLGGIVGSVAVFAGLLLTARIGSGPFNGLVITANILMSLAIDNFGLFNQQIHPLNIFRVLGGALMLGGIALIAVF